MSFETQKTTLNLAEIYRAFMDGLVQTTTLEYIAVVAGIISVWFSKKDNILVYPVGLINTVLFIYLSIKGQLIGEASVNLFYTIMSIYGWILWSRHDEQNKKTLLIQFCTVKEWVGFLLFFAVLFVIIFFSLLYLKTEFAPGAIPSADAFASASAYTGMLLMARKKVESWYWWIITNITSIPLYFVKGYLFTSFQFLVLLVMAISGLISWHKKAKNANKKNRYSGT